MSAPLPLTSPLLIPLALALPGAPIDAASRAVGALAAAAYAVVPSAAAAVVLATLAVGAAVLPLLVRAGRAGRRRAALAPALAELRAELAAGGAAPAEVQAAIVALHRERGVPLLGGLGATLVQGAAFALLLHSIRGVFHRSAGALAPSFLPAGSAMRGALGGAAAAPWLGADLAASGWASLTHGPAGGAVFLGLALAVGGLAHLQQRLARRDAAGGAATDGVPPAVRRLLPVLTWSWLAFGLTVPLAVSVSVATSSFVRLVAALVAHRHPLPPA